MASQLDKAIVLRSTGDYAAAEVIMNELHHAHPTDALVNYHFAWLCDVQGKEAQAVPYYETAIANGLSDEALRGALLGLGSTYRTLGMYQQSVATLKQGIDRFPDAKEFPIFLAMALYNIGDYKQAVSDLLKLLLTVSDHPTIQRYQAAITLYADDLDKTWLDDN